MTEKIIAWVIALLTISFVIWVTCRLAYGEAPDPIAAGIRHLQPTATPDRAARLASVFRAAGDRHKLDPLLLVAVSFRESSLSQSVESRRKRGALGELGLMQSHGVALGFRPADCTHHLIGARCQVETGAAFLSEARRQCGGSWWRWVAAYGLGACPSEERARTMTGVRIARRYYVAIGGKGWRAAR